VKKHRVIVAECDTPTYLANGYRPCSGPDMWDGVPEEMRAGLVPMENTAIAHEGANQLPRAYRIVGFNSTRIDRQYRMEEVGLMERNEFGDCYIATSEGADCVNSSSVYDSRGECAAGEAASLREKVRLLRESADSIEEFMLRIECPSAEERP
jgi:hypothetical protein